MTFVDGSRAHTWCETVQRRVLLMVTAVQRGLPWPLLKPTGTYVWPRSSPFLRLRGLQRPCVSRPSAHQGHPGCEALLCRTLRCVRCQRKLGMGPPPQCRPRPGGAHRSGVGAHCLAVTPRWRCPAVCISQHLLCGLSRAYALGTLATILCIPHPQLC